MRGPSELAGVQVFLACVAAAVLMGLLCAFGYLWVAGLVSP